MNRLRLGAAVAAIATAGVLAAWFLLAGKKADAVRVERRDVIQSVVASGRVAAPHRVDVGSQVVGVVEDVPVDEGQTVKAGQVLVRLDRTEALANLRQAEATLANTRAQYARNKRLADAGFVGGAALDDAQHAMDVAGRQVDAARARLAYTTIAAPRDGVLIARDVERGDVVQPGKVLMVLSPAGATQIVLQIDERNLGRLREGQSAIASADAYPRERFAARLVYINPGVDAQRGTVEVKLLVPDPPAYLRQDMTVSADIEVGRSAATLALAADAVREGESSAPWVLRVNKGQAERRVVALGLRGGGVVEIRSGLEAGDVVLLGNGAAASGARVRPRLHE